MSEELNRLFLKIGGLGTCTPKGKTITSFGFERQVAPPDRPLSLVIGVLHLVVKSAFYTSRESAVHDFEELHEVVTGMLDRPETIFEETETC